MAKFFYQLSVEENFRTLEAQPEGLSQEEALQRLNLYGLNKIIAGKTDPLLFKFFRQFKDLMVILLIVAGFLSLYLESYRDAIIMFVIVFINACIGFFQEYKAEKVMQSLKTLVQAKAKVVRQNQVTEIDAQKLVPGDIVKLEEGDSVPADLRIFEENNLATNDFALTGESNPTRKFTHPISTDSTDVALGDRNNLSFMGTTVAMGNARGIVVATGMETEIGRIAHLSQETDQGLSPLQMEFNSLAKTITKITVFIWGVLFIIGFFLDFTLREAFVFGLGVAASTVPQGLPAQVSVALSLASGRLAKKKAIIKKLSAVETLGSTHIICTDKTGTLTTNEMTVQNVLIGDTAFEVTGVGYEPKGDIRDGSGVVLSPEQLVPYRLFFENGVFASNATINSPDKEHLTWYSVGDPTEAALITLAAKAGVECCEIEQHFQELKEFTFDAGRKRMSSIRPCGAGYRLYAKGSPQSLLACCTKIWDGSAVRPMTEEDRQFILLKVDEYATKALRNLGFAYRDLERFDSAMTLEEAEQDLIWLGLVSMMDPPRAEVREAIEVALKAKIRVIIITGDYALTAKAIAEKIGMNAGAKEQSITVVTGQQLHQMSDIELLHQLIHSNLIFARTAPEDKMRIVELLRKSGEIVAVTGDGVNDAPALKMADIGVAMGKTGTEVAKNAGEIVLLDDSFSTLVTAIREGRIIFQNLKKTILSSLSKNGGELFSVLLSIPGSIFLAIPMSITAVQILSIDLISEMLPLTFLTWDPANEELMTQPPRNRDDHILHKKSLVELGWSGLLMGFLAFSNFLLVFFREGVSPYNLSTEDPFYFRASTMTYISLVLIQWSNILSRRCGVESIFSSYVWSNKPLIWSFVISFIFALNICYNPYVTAFLGTGPLTFGDWGFGILAALIFLTVREVYKASLRRKVSLDFL